MRPLYAVLEAVERARGPVSLEELSRELAIEPGALQGMVAFWAQKGRVRFQAAAGSLPGAGAACSPAACEACPAAGRLGCPLTSASERQEAEGNVE